MLLASSGVKYLALVLKINVNVSYNSVSLILKRLYTEMHAVDFNVITTLSSFHNASTQTIVLIFLLELLCTFVF